MYLEEIMWIIKWILSVFFILFIIYFGAENSTQIVYVKFLNRRSPELQLWMVMYLSFGVGMLTSLFGSIFKIVQIKTEVRKKNKENFTLRKELDNLRNITIEEETELSE